MILFDLHKTKKAGSQKPAVLVLFGDPKSAGGRDFTRKLHELFSADGRK